jgi:hypothetical protein
LSATWIQSNTFPKAVTVTANVAGTIYFAEGAFVVKTVSDITSAPLYRWAKGTVTSVNTPTSIAIDVDEVTNGYYRVFVANSQGVLSAPATNIVTISVPRTPTATTSTTTTTIAPASCATGGVCIVGDTGPGGGIVFYVSATNFTSTGSDCNTTCRYLEAAPTDQSSGIVWATTAPKCWNTAAPTGDGSNNNNCQSFSIYSPHDTPNQADSRTAALAIGMGMANTNAIYDRFDSAGDAVATNTYAAGIAYAYANNGKTDWYLPSKDELAQLFAEKARVGGFSTGGYWSSSEINVEGASYQDFSLGVQDYGYKSDALYVRPVRAG